MPQNSDNEAAWREEFVRLTREWKDEVVELTKDYSKGVAALNAAMDEYDKQKNKLYVKYWWVALVAVAFLGLYGFTFVVSSTNACSASVGFGDYSISIKKSETCKE